MLQKMERIVPAHVDSPFEFEFREPVKTPRPLLTVEDAASRYGDRNIVSGINVSIGPQDRIALLGPNGAGKSTLTKMLAGEAAPSSGRRIPAADLAVGYFAQQQMEQLRPDCTAFWHMRNLGGADYAGGEEQRVRDHLGSFGFRGDRAFEPVGTFSGGEKARLTLALLVARRPNLLLLDEPTNHLDLDMRHALTVALQGFEGGMLVVSHDRHLIKTVADTLWLVADGKIKVFDGDLDDYQEWLKSRGKAREDGKARDGSQTTAEPRKAPRRRDALTQWRRELSQIERRIGVITAELAALDAELQDFSARGKHVKPGKAAKPDEFAKLADKRARLSRDAAAFEARWVEVGTAIEEAEAQSS
jgi:ATP-binding cassette subfamily F protein 3